MGADSVSLKDHQPSPDSPAFVSNIHSNAFVDSENFSHVLAHNEDDDNIDISHYKCIKCLHVNIRSLLPKMDKLLDIVNQHKINILSVNESNVDLSVDDNELKFEGFTSFRHDVSLYVNSNLHPMPVTQLNNGCNIQAVWVKLHSVYGKDDHLLLCSMYRPPNSSVEYFNNIVENIEIASAYSHDYIISGDLNIDVKWYSKIGKLLWANSTNTIQYPNHY